MLKVGEYKTKKGHTGRVLFMDEDGNGSGYIVKNKERFAAAWYSSGEDMEGKNNEFDLIVNPPIITIPETTLPEPMREAPEVGQQVYMVEMVVHEWTACRISWPSDGIYIHRVYCGLVHDTREAAQQWADFLNKFVVKK